MEKGTLKSEAKVKLKNPKQAIALWLSETRGKVAKVLAKKPTEKKLLPKN